MKKSVILLSGGLDSATCGAIARDMGFELYALSFSYGQRHACELLAAQNVAASLGVAEHRIAAIDLSIFGGSALTSNDIAVPKDGGGIDRGIDGMTSGGDDDKRGAAIIPVTYVPARNTIFLSFALAWAETLGAEAIFIGANSIDYSGYPDCRPEFIAAFQKMANLATAAGVGGREIAIRAPLMDMSKGEIIRTGAKLGVDYALTHSCYDPSPNGLACGSCDSCRIRRAGFEEAGVPDPTKYI